MVWFITFWPMFGADGAILLLTLGFIVVERVPIVLLSFGSISSNPLPKPSMNPRAVFFPIAMKTLDGELMPRRLFAHAGILLNKSEKNDSTLCQTDFAPSISP